MYEPKFDDIARTGMLPINTYRVTTNTFTGEYKTSYDTLYYSEALRMFDDFRKLYPPLLDKNNAMRIALYELYKGTECLIEVEWVKGVLVQ